MAQLHDLLDGFVGADIKEIAQHIEQRAKDLKLKLFLDDGEKNIYIPKSRLDSEIAKNVELKKTLDSQVGDIAKIKNLTKDNEKAQQTIADLEASMTAMKQSMKDNSLSLALRTKAAELKAIDESGQDLLAFIDKSKLIVNEDGSVTGLDEALNTLKASKQYLFHAPEQKHAEQVGTGAPGRPASGVLPGSKSAKAGDFGAALSKGLTQVSNQKPIQTPVFDFFK